jgi:hypothetical protein
VVAGLVVGGVTFTDKHVDCGLTGCRGVYL